MRLGVDVEVQLVAFLAPGGARLVFGAVGHHDRNVMIIRVNFGFHGLSYGARAPAIWNGNGRIWALYNASRRAKQAPDRHLPAPPPGPIWEPRQSDPQR